jgi:hypothetical protein
MFDRGIKRLDILDLVLIELTVAFFVLGVIAFSPAITSWVQAQYPWLFLLLAAIMAVRPIYSFWFR